MERLKTIAVNGCDQWDDLIEVIDFFESFISTSRDSPVVWYKDDLYRRIQEVRNGGELNLVTRANGIRDKVKE